MADEETKIETQVSDTIDHGNSKEVVVTAQEVPVEAEKAPEESQETTEEVNETPEVTDETNPLQPFEDEFSEKGELSPDSYSKLQEMGYGKDMVDVYIRGQQAISAENEEALYAPVGGKEAYTKMADWASTNLSEAELKDFNDSVEGGEQATKMALQYLKGKYDAAQAATPRNPNGTYAPKRIQGTAPAKSGGVKPFATEAEMKQAFADPRYQTSEAFRDEVAKRLLKS